MTVATRAEKGGQHGVNGAFYEGGQFLPSSPTTVKGEFSRTKATQQAKPRKQEIAPYKWEVSEQTSIWAMVNGWCKFHKTGYSKETGAQGWLEVVSGGYNGSHWEANQELADRWNNGERWM